MKRNQIVHILESNGFSEDSYINLKPVSEIILTTNENLYPSDEIDFYFNSNEVLLVYYKKKNADGEFVREAKPRFCINYLEIQGFMFTSAIYGKKPYVWGKQV